MLDQRLEVLAQLVPGLALVGGREQPGQDEEVDGREVGGAVHEVSSRFEASGSLRREATAARIMSRTSSRRRTTSSARTRRTMIAPALERDILAAVATIGVFVLEVVVAVDLDREAEVAGEEVDLHRPTRPERDVERRVQLEHPGGLRERCQPLEQEPLGGAAGPVIGPRAGGPEVARATSRKSSARPTEAPSSTSLRIGPSICETTPGISAVNLRPISSPSRGRDGDDPGADQGLLARLGGETDVGVEVAGLDRQDRRQPGLDEGQACQGAGGRLDPGRPRRPVAEPGRQQDGPGPGRDERFQGGCGLLAGPGAVPPRDRRAQASRQARGGGGLPGGIPLDDPTTRRLDSGSVPAHRGRVQEHAQLHRGHAGDPRPEFVGVVAQPPGEVNERVTQQVAPGGQAVGPGVDHRVEPGIVDQDDRPASPLGPTLPLPHREPDRPHQDRDGREGVLPAPVMTIERSGRIEDGHTPPEHRMLPD